MDLEHLGEARILVHGEPESSASFQLALSPDPVTPRMSHGTECTTEGVTAQVLGQGILGEPLPSSDDGVALRRDEITPALLGPTSQGFSGTTGSSSSSGSSTPHPAAIASALLRQACSSSSRRRG